ncbi:MAG TPA: TadE family protein [Bryobacteraceae bacterium]|nr:TadE family protein [Bryobacteraceae bacterium]
MLRCGRGARRGAAMVEGALIALAFIVTVTGALEVSQMFFFHQAFRERVRAGVRYAVVHEYSPELVRNFVLYNSPEPKTGRGFLGLEPSLVSVNRYDTGGDTDRIEVSIRSYPLRFFTPWLAGRTFQPVFRAVQPVESLGATD